MSSVQGLNIVWNRIRPVPSDSVFDAVDLAEEALRRARLVIPTAQRVRLAQAIRLLAEATRDAGLPSTVALFVSEK